MANTLASGASARKGLEVQLLSWAYGFRAGLKTGPLCVWVATGARRDNLPHAHERPHLLELLLADPGDLQQILDALEAVVLLAKLQQALRHRRADARKPLQLFRSSRVEVDSALGRVGQLAGFAAAALTACLAHAARAWSGLTLGFRGGAIRGRRGDFGGSAAFRLLLARREVELATVLQTCRQVDGICVGFRLRTAGSFQGIFTTGARPQVIHAGLAHRACHMHYDLPGRLPICNRLRIRQRIAGRRNRLRRGCFLGRRLTQYYSRRGSRREHIPPGRQPYNPYHQNQQYHQTDRLLARRISHPLPLSWFKTHCCFAGRDRWASLARR